MSKLSWDYHGDEQRAEYRGFVIRAIHDTDCEDPIAEQDGHWPMIKGGDRDHDTTVYDKVKGVGVDAPLDRFTDEHLVHDQIALAKIFDTTVEHMLDLATDGAVVRKYVQDAALLRDMFENAIGDVGNTSRLDVFAALYQLLNIPHLNTVVRGYCQGDQADLLIVATPEAIAELRPDVTPEQLELDMRQQADLWKAWAYGNVWGYVVEDDDGDEISSCWGFYGDPDSEMSGLEEAAIDAIDHHLRYVQQQRQAKLKELIRNRVPLRLREHLLAA